MSLLAKQAQPTIDKLLSEEKNARLVFQNFRCLSTIGRQKASNLCDCVAKMSSEAFWKFIGVYGQLRKPYYPENADEKLTAMAVKQD